MDFARTIAESQSFYILEPSSSLSWTTEGAASWANVNNLNLNDLGVPWQHAVFANSSGVLSYTVAASSGHIGPAKLAFAAYGSFGGFGCHTVASQ